MVLLKLLWTFFLTSTYGQYLPQKVDLPPSGRPILLAKGAPVAATAKSARTQGTAQGSGYPAGVRPMFDSAQELYRAGKFAAAAQAYEAILRRYPGHQPTTQQLAKTYYRLDRMKDAFHAFSRVPLQQLDAETSYEYGYTFYSQKSFEGCVKALKGVPEGHSLFDLAQYYTGICHLKLKRFKDAETSFEKTMVLPDKLAKSRSLYLKHIEAILLNLESQQLADERRRLSKEPKAGKVVAKKKPTEKPSPTKTQDPPAYQGFKGTGKYASVKFLSENQSIDYNGNKQESFESTSGHFSLSTTPHYFLPVSQGKDRFGAVGMAIGLSASSATIKGKRQLIMLDEKDESIQRYLTNTLPTKDEKKGSWSLEPWIEIPLPLNLWSAAGLNVAVDFPDFERGNRSATQDFYAQLGGKHSLFSYGTQINYKQLIDPKNSPTTKIVGMQVHGAIEPSPLTALSGIVRYENYSYPNPEKRVSGPDSVIRAEGDLVQSFPLGFSLRFAGMADTEINKIHFDMPTYDAIAATSTNLTGLGSLVYGGVGGGPPYPGRSGRPPKFIPFFDAAITVIAKQTYWKVADRETEGVFKLNVPDYVEQVQAELNLGLSF